MDHQSVLSAYRRYAGVYDVLFGPLFEPGRRRLIAAMDCRPGETVLEAGVGTGLSLPHYPAHVGVVGIDLSPHMLERAHQRAQRMDLKNIELRCMDVQQLDFPDDHFDKVACMYIASVVPDPEAMLAELKRVCRAGGDVFVLNHFSGTQGAVRRIEQSLSPLARRLGFRPLFPLDDFVALTDMELVAANPVNAFGYWTLVHLRNTAKNGKQTASGHALAETATPIADGHDRTEETAPAER